MTTPAHTLTGAYALDALDDIERRQFERHLAECPDCRQEVAELRATAVRLGTAVSEAAPDRLRQRVLEEIARTRQEAPKGGRTRSAPTDPRSWAVRISGAAAAVALVAAGVLGGIVVHEHGELSDTQSRLAQADARYAPVAQVLAQPDAQVASGPGPDGGKGTVMMSRSLGKGVFLASGLPALPAGKTYQAWLMAPGQVRSAGLVRADDVPLVMTGLGRGDDQSFGLTIEPAGGSRSPTGNPIVQFPLPA